MLAPPWIKFNPGIAFAGIMNQQLDDANINEARGSMSKDNETQDSSVRNLQNDARGPMMPDGMTESMQNLFKIHQMVFKKSNFIKEPQLFSKDIEV